MNVKVDKAVAKEFQAKAKENGHVQRVLFMNWMKKYIKESK